MEDYVTGTGQHLRVHEGVAGIAKKLCDAMKKVKRVEKRGRNEFHRYKYAKEEDVAEEVRDAMADAGLALVFDIHHLDVSERSTSKGGTTYLTTLHITYTLLDSETGASWPFHMIGQSLDDQDKGIYKALTGAQKYVYLKLLMIGTGDDPEADEKVEKPEPARGTMAAAFKPGDPATHTDVRTAQKAVLGGPATLQPSASINMKLPQPKPSLARPKIAEGPAITDEEWNEQLNTWEYHADAAPLVLEVKQYFGIRTIAELTPTQRYGFMTEMEKRLSERGE